MVMPRLTSLQKDMMSRLFALPTEAQIPIIEYLAGSPGDKSMEMVGSYVKDLSTAEIAVVNRMISERSAS